LYGKNILSIDAVEHGKQQIWSLNHNVFHTPSYLSHLWWHANNTRKSGLYRFIGQGHMFKLQYRYSLQPAFFAETFCSFVSLALKFAARAFTSLYFQTLW